MNLLATITEAALSASAPQIEWLAIMPIVITAGAGVLLVLLEIIPNAQVRRTLNAFVAIAAMVVALVMALVRWNNVLQNGATGPVMAGELQEDTMTLPFQAILLLVALLALIVVVGRNRRGDGSFAPQAGDRPGSAAEAYATRVGYQRSEVYALMLFSTAGMLAFIQAVSLLALFVALEVMSLPLYVMAATGRRRRLLSQESGFKYFLLGAYASAFFLMGIALLYGYSGSLNLAQITLAEGGAGMDWMLLAGTAMVLIGMFFKVGAVPFHAWSPDVYQGAPSPITGFMAAGVKVAAFAALLRVVGSIGFGLQWDLQILFWVVALATMALGTFMGIVQDDIKRMLAYSSIAHVGFILIALVGLSGETTPAILFYVLGYGIATVGAFAMVSIVRETDESGAVLGEATKLANWKGLGKKHPLYAGAMLIFLLSFAGIPLTAGFMGKFLVFSVGIANGASGLVIAAIIASAITAFFYFRLVRVMFFEEPEDSATIPAGDVITKVVVVISAALTLILGVAPQAIIALFNAGANL